MLDTAELLVNIVIKTHMPTRGVDRQTALHWVRCASEIVLSTRDDCVAQAARRLDRCGS
jgi:hypothetical protein